MIPTPPPTTRKKPHCRTCGLPMAGHKRPHGRPVCPVNTTPSPQPAPGLHPPSLTTPPPPKEGTGALPALVPQKYVAPVALPSPVVTPQQGALRLRNSNWTPASLQHPTVLVNEDRHKIKDPELTDNKFDIDDGLGPDASVLRASSFTLMSRELAELNRPAVSIFDTPRRDIAHTRATAARLGVSSAVERSPQRARLPPPAGSLVPTALADEDRHTIKDMDFVDDEFDGPDIGFEDGTGPRFRLDTGAQRTTSPHVLMSRLAELNRPVVSIFDTKREDITHIQEMAARLGVHSAVIHRVPPGCTRGVRREHSWWVVLGQDASVIDEIVSAQHAAMPGALASDAEMAATVPLCVVPFIQLVFAGFIGGCVVVLALLITTARV